MLYIAQEKLESLNEFIAGKPSGQEIIRALAVKLSCEKYTYRQIQKILSVSIGFISKWKQRFCTSGIEGLKSQHKGAKSYLKKEEKESLINWLKTQEYCHKEELAYQVASQYGVGYKSQESYYKLLKEAGITWKKSQKKNPKKNQELIEKKKKRL